MSLAYRVVDVFTDRPFSGNALCVVLDECPASLMQAVAREVNLSETTFPTVTESGAYRMRIFTPAAELPFAGHPSLGTAWVLGAGTWEQTTSGAVVTVDADADGAVMTQPDPEIIEVEGGFVATAAGNRMLLVPTDEPLESVTPDHAAIARIARERDVSFVCRVGRLDDRNLHVRVFVPGAGIAEDPGTGSAAGPIGVLARRLWGTDVDVTIRQGDEIGRPCRVEVHAADGDLRVGGRVVASAEGRFLA